MAGGDGDGVYAWVGPQLGVAWSGHEAVVPLVVLDPAVLDAPAFALMVADVATQAKESGLMKDQCPETDGLRFGRVVLTHLLRTRHPAVVTSRVRGSKE